MLIHSQRRARAGLGQILKSYLFPFSAFKDVDRQVIMHYMYRKNLIALILKLVLEVGFALFDLEVYSFSPRAEVWAANSDWDKEQIFNMKMVTILVRFSKILLVPMYFRYPQTMRFLFIFDALDRCMASFLPYDMILLAKDLPYVLTIDLIGNYCLDFSASLTALLIEIVMIFSLNVLAMKEEINIMSRFLFFFIFVMMIVIFVIVVAFFGFIVIKSIRLEQIRMQDE